MKSAVVDEKPKATLAILCHNQERYIEAALQSCIDQQFDSLEIIICDDHSTDNTWQRILSLASSADCRHQIRLVQNPKRLGVISNVNHAFSLANGDFIVLQAGDDISMPNRVSTLYDFWLEHERPLGMCSDIVLVNKDTQALSRSNYMSEWWNSYKHLINSCQGEWADQLLAFVDESRPCLIGCASAYSREVYEIFGALPDHLTNEDVALTVRAAMAGRVYYVDIPLVYYRQHAEALNNRPSPIINSRTSELGRLIDQVQCHIHDCNHAIAHSLVKSDEAIDLLSRLQRLHDEYVRELDRHSRSSLND